jgi:hypothetical protein
MPDEEFSPSLTLDDVWHTHITCTKAYMAFCDEYFGAYVHHDPTVFPVKRYHDTLAAYFKFFSNNPPPLAWPEPTIALPGTKKAAAAAKSAAKKKAPKAAAAAVAAAPKKSTVAKGKGKGKSAAVDGEGGTGKAAAKKPAAKAKATVKKAAAAAAKPKRLPQAGPKIAKITAPPKAAAAAKPKPKPKPKNVYTEADMKGQFGQHMSMMGYNPRQFLGAPRGSVFTGCG